MATKNARLVARKSSTALAVPLAGSTLVAEILLNVADKKLYSKDETAIFQVAPSMAEHNLKAPISSPAFTDAPTAPTPSTADNSTKLATTAFVKTVVNALIDAAPGALDTLNELAAALGDDPNFAATVTASLAGKQPLSSNLTVLSGTAPGTAGLSVLGSSLVGEVRDLLDTAPYVATRAALKTIDTSKDTTAFLTEPGREGTFIWKAGNYSAQVAADTAEGIYVKATAIAATAGAWVRQFAEFASIKWFGCVGDYDPVARTGTNDTAAIQAAFAACVALNVEIAVPSGVYYHLGELVYPVGKRLRGAGRRLSQFYIEIDNTMAGSRFLGQNMGMDDIGHVVWLSSPLGPDDGEYGSGATLGKYFTNGTPVAVGKFVANRIGFYKAPGSPYFPAHALNGLGRISGVYVNDLEVEDYSGSAIHFHWGANGTGLGSRPVATYHPNDIRIRNVTAKNCGKTYTFSSCFNVSLTGIKANCKIFGDLLPGDEADTYAVAEEKPFVGSAIHISDFNVDGLVDINPASDSDGSMKIVSLGISKCDFDVSTGLGTQRLLYWKAICIENGKLKGADDVSRGIDLTGAAGEGIIRNVNITELSRAKTGIRVADTRGNWLLDGISVASTTGIDWTRAVGVRCVNMSLTLLNRAGLTGDQTALGVTGSEATTTLTANKAANATSITVAGLSTVLRPGDTIVVDGNNIKVSGTRLIRSGETSIPIEAMTWSALSGATVYCDQRSVPDITYSYFEGYDFGATLSNCLRVNIVANKFVDIAKQGVTGIAKVGSIGSNEFVRGGQHRLIDAAYPSRNIILAGGSEGIVLDGNILGVGAKLVEIWIQTSTDSGAIQVINSIIGDGVPIVADFSLATQNSARLTASQYNEFRGNKRRDGAMITGPATWYEILQNGIIRYHGTAPPTLGDVRAGSTADNTTPTRLTPTSWHCITTGPGGGASWRANGTGYGTTAERPALTARDAGWAYFDSTLAKMIMWNGAAWLV